MYDLPMVKSWELLQNGNNRQTLHVTPGVLWNSGTMGYFKDFSDHSVNYLNLCIVRNVFYINCYHIYVHIVIKLSTPAYSKSKLHKEAFIRYNSEQ